MNRLSFCAIFFTAAVIVGSVFGLGQDLSSTNVVGGEGGNQFADYDIPDGARILEVRISSGNYVDSVQMVYLLPEGRTVATERHGGPGGKNKQVFRLDSDEYITGISGRSGRYIDSIQIHTNKRTSPVFGGSGGKNPYRINIPRGYQGAGFCGRAGNYLDAIGLTYMPTWLQPAGKTAIEGGRGGSAFEDRQIPRGARISAVYIWAGNLVDRVQFVYTLRDGSLFEGEAHGGGGGDKQVFRLADNEYITSISGRYGNVVDSIRIHTNRRTSDTYGGSGGRTNFRIRVPSGNQAIGFTGRAGTYLDAIGLQYSQLRDQEGRRKRPAFDRNRSNRR